MKRLAISAVTLIISTLSWAACKIDSQTKHPAAKQHDALYKLLTNAHRCPTDVFAFRHELKNAQFTLTTTMVANRGFHNPSLGSFSLFEIVTGNEVNAGEFFFGHFTTINAHNQLALDQDPSLNSLMIEAFAWDAQKSMYNFYELRGDGQQGQWFYRGDSADIYADNSLLHRQPDSNHPQFGNRLRCSGCHDAGGPIMKELSQPHNDWWQLERKLDFGGRQPDAELQNILTTLQPASSLASHVHAGINKLGVIQDKLSLPEQLRPLFCPVEINLASDDSPNSDNHALISIPLNFFIDPRLLDKNTDPIFISRSYYENILHQVNSRFPETNDKDADHAWLTPVKATSDIQAIDHLVKEKIIDEAFILSVLAVDMTNPAFSTSRCQLLRYVPNNATARWKQDFIHNLTASNNQAAHQLARYLTNEKRSAALHKTQAMEYINQCRIKLLSQEHATKTYKLLLQRRLELHASEISKNPRGQILEPGFRVIFPESSVKSLPNQLMLTANCDIIFTESNH